MPSKNKLAKARQRNLSKAFKHASYYIKYILQFAFSILINVGTHSKVSKIFLSCYGIESIDTDKIAREVTRRGEGCLEELTQYFSDIILDGDGELDRKKLADIAFADKNRLEILNKITHGHILNACREKIADMAEEGKNAVIIDAPLLFESKFSKHCHVIISVTAEINLRLERIIKRDNLSLEQAVRRIESQKDDDFFLRNSSYVIYNNGSLRDVERQVADIYTSMLKYDLI